MDVHAGNLKEDRKGGGGSVLDPPSREKCQSTNKEWPMEKIHEEMFKAWRLSWENYVKTLTALQEQGEKMLDLFFTQMGSLQQEGKKIFQEGIANMKAAQKTYLRTVDENLEKMEGLFKS
jgi:hypothetical protein